MEPIRITEENAIEEVCMNCNPPTVAVKTGALVAEKLSNAQQQSASLETDIKITKKPSSNPALVPGCPVGYKE